MHESKAGPLERDAGKEVGITDASNEGKEENGTDEAISPASEIYYSRKCVAQDCNIYYSY